MKLRHFRWAVIASVVGSCLFCFVAQGVLWECLHACRARLLSSNHNTITLSRLQNTTMLTGSTVMLGSSITERLMPSDDIATIGVPGSNFLGGMQLVRYENFPAGTVFVLECNHMFSPVNEDVLNETKKWSFQMFRGSRHFSIAAMPSSLLLSALYYMTGAYTHTLHDKALLSDSVCQPRQVGDAERMTEDELRQCAALAEGIRELRARGYRVCLAFMPERDSSRYDSIMPRILSFAREVDVPVLDYTQQPFAAQLEFTDSVHLSSRALSTTRFRNTVARDAQHCAR